MWSIASFRSFGAVVLNMTRRDNFQTIERIARNRFLALEIT